MLTAIFISPCQNFVDAYFNEFYDLVMMMVVTPTTCIHLQVCAQEPISGEENTNSRRMLK
jgi:hypothetical protein